MELQRSVHGGNVLLSSPGMHAMADRIHALIEEKARVEGRNANFTRTLVETQTFACGELKPKILETVRGEHVFLLQQLKDPDPNNAIMEMYLTLDALTRANVTGITVVAPYIPYSRQDRKDEKRVPISAAALANLIQSVPDVKQLITFDLHAEQIMGMFRIPVDNLYAAGALADYFKKQFRNNLSNVTVVSPDVGATKRSQKFAGLLGKDVPLAIIDKRRQNGGEAEVFALLGEVRGRDCIMPDDMIDGGGTNRSGVKAIMEAGANSIVSCATFGIFSNDAERKFAAAGHPVVIADAIARSEGYYAENSSWLRHVSIDRMLADAIYETSLVGGSVSKLSEAA
jgi:ribose-phosphate pyrophosphokinase